MAETGVRREEGGGGLDEEEDRCRPLIEIEGSDEGGTETLDGLLRRFVQGILRPKDPSTPIVRRIKVSYGENAPRLKEASRNTLTDVVSWAHRGSPLRVLLVVSVGTIISMALAALTVFMFFFVVATLNAIIIAFFMSLAAAMGVLAIFFSLLTAIYVGALSVAVFVISTIIISATIAVLVATGWVGFFWIVWAAAKRSVALTKKSISITGSAFSA